MVINIISVDQSSRTKEDLMFTVRLTVAQLQSLSSPHTIQSIYLTISQSSTRGRFIKHTARNYIPVCHESSQYAILDYFFISASLLDCLQSSVKYGPELNY